MTDDAPELQVQGELSEAALDALAELLIEAWLKRKEDSDVRAGRAGVSEVEGATVVAGQPGVGGG